MRKYLLLGLLSFISILSVGQNPPAFRQFNFNPFLFNSAYAGSNGYTEVYLVHRQQWLGFDDAPVISGFNIQYPTYKRVAFGFNFTTQEVVALRNSTAMLTFAYGIPIARNQSLRFGISGGVGLNNLSLDEDYSDDPTILNAAANKVYADGNFGALYSIGQLKIGFALPKLFGQKSVSPQELDGNRFTQLKNQLYSLSYKFNIVPEKISMEPYFLYHLSRDNQNSWEAASTITFKDKIWTGVSYHNTNGLAFFLGLNIKDKFRFGYSYELPPTNSSFVNTNSHEFHLNLRLGKKKNVKSADKPAKSPTTEEVLVEEKPIQKEEDSTAQVEPIAPVRAESSPESTRTKIDSVNDSGMKVLEKPKTEIVAEVEKPKPTVEPIKISKPPRSFALAKGHYVVVGAFRIMENATKYLMTLKGKDYQDVNLAINTKNNLYYIYIFSSYDIEEARKARNQYRLRRPFSEAWIFSME